MEEGIQVFLKERNYTLAGRKVELIIADTGGNPVGAKTKTQELVERNKVHVIIGPLATFEALAIDDYIKEARVPLITPTSAAQNDLAQQKHRSFQRTQALQHDEKSKGKRLGQHCRLDQFLALARWERLRQPGANVEFALYPGRAQLVDAKPHNDG